MADLTFPGLIEPGSTECLSVMQLRENLTYFTALGGVFGANLHPGKDVLVRHGDDYWQLHTVAVSFINGRIALELNAGIRDEPALPKVYAAVGRALALHRPEAGDLGPCCTYCTKLNRGHVPWPCPTVEAIGLQVTGTDVHEEHGPALEPLRLPRSAAEAAATFPYVPGLELDSANPEPPPGVIVRICDGSLWHRTDTDGPLGAANWDLLDTDAPDPETWLKVAGVYGPVTVALPEHHEP